MLSIMIEYHGFSVKLPFYAEKGILFKKTWLSSTLNLRESVAYNDAHLCHILL